MHFVYISSYLKMSSYFFRTCFCFLFLHGLGRKGVISLTVVRSNGDETAELQCRFSISPQQFSRVTWTKDIEDKIVEIAGCTAYDITTCGISLSSHGKYAVHGSLSSGFTLAINEVTLEDDGMYNCKAILQTGLVEEDFRLYVTYVPNTIAIFDVKKDIEISNMNKLYAVADSPYILNCSVPSPCNPPANISWLVGDVDAEEFEQADHTSVPGSPLMTSSKTVELTTNEEDSGKIVSCIAMHYGLVDPLRLSATLEVGTLPESPPNARISSVTVNSFVVTWMQGASGGHSQTFSVIYCAVLTPEGCLEIPQIKLTRVKIDNLRPFTSYSVTVKSQTVFGISIDNTEIEQSTRSLSPQELGVEGVYTSQYGGAVHVQAKSNSSLLPSGLCFQLVDQGFDPSADTSVTAIQDCVNVGEYLVLPGRRSWKKMALVGYGNGLYSASSKITGKDEGSSLPLIIGASVGGAVFLIILMIIVYCKTKGSSSSKAVGNSGRPPQPLQTRQPIGRGRMEDLPGDDPPGYYGVKYHEVKDPPETVCPVGDLYATHHSYHYTPQPSSQKTSKMPREAHGNGQYYSRNIAMGVEKEGEVAEGYGYMEPRQ